MGVRLKWGWTAGLLLVAMAAGLALYQQRDAVPAPEVSAGSTAVADDPIGRVLAAGKPAVIEFGANACASCRDMKPVLESLVRSHGDHISVLDMDIIRQRELIARYQIRLMPTQIFFDAQGQEIGRHMGKISGEDILARLGVAAVP